MIDAEDREVIDRFTALYCGGIAEKLRAAGDAEAMPPWAEVFWLGKQVSKCPLDLWIYQEILVETRPDLLVETGTSTGGSAFFFATIFDLIGHGKVITVDKDAYREPGHWREHPRIEYIVGDSISQQVASQIRGLSAGQRTMVALDSLHTYQHVARELELYAPLVTLGCYLVVEDTGVGDGTTGEWANRAVCEFVAAHPEFAVDLGCERHLLTSNHRGWLKRTE